MKILLIGDINSVFVEEFTKWMRKTIETKFDIFTKSRPLRQYSEKMYCNVFFTRSTRKILSKIPVIRAFALAAKCRKQLNELDEYDIGHVHYLDTNYGLYAETIKNKCRHLIISFWGSDLYQTTRGDKFLQKRLLERADIITFTNKKTSQDFTNIFGNRYSHKIRVARFGLTPLQKLQEIENETQHECRLRLGLPTDSIIVSCAYSGTPVHKHIKMIESIRRASSALPGNIFLLFPMTYGGSSEYRETVKQHLNKSGYNYKIMDTFMSDEDVARLRKASDILINVPLTDQFSGSMQEHIYAGNIVITGAWLPYDLLDERGVFMLKVSSVEEVGEQLVYTVKNFENLSKITLKSKDIIWDLSSWQANIPAWIDLYQKLKTAR